MRHKFFLSFFLFFILGSTAYAGKPINYDCKSTDFRDNVKNAKYIVVARLEKYLPDYKGEFRVLMNLRGPIQPGTKLIQYAYPPSPVESSANSGIRLGADILFKGETYETHENYLKLNYYKCFGRSGVGKMPSGDRPNLYPVIDLILTQEK